MSPFPFPFPFLSFPSLSDLCLSLRVCIRVRGRGRVCLCVPSLPSVSTPSPPQPAPLLSVFLHPGSLVPRTVSISSGRPAGRVCALFCIPPRVPLALLCRAANTPLSTAHQTSGMYARCSRLFTRMKQPRAAPAGQTRETEKVHLSYFSIFRIRAQDLYIPRAPTSPRSLAPARTPGAQVTSPPARAAAAPAPARGRRPPRTPTRAASPAGARARGPLRALAAGAAARPRRWSRGVADSMTARRRRARRGRVRLLAGLRALRRAWWRGPAGAARTRRRSRRARRSRRGRLRPARQRPRGTATLCRLAWASR